MNNDLETGGIGREYLAALKRQAFLLLGLSLLAAVVTYGVAARLPERHEVYFSYVVSLVEREQGEEFRFDGYYALQATDLFAATLARWVATPEVVAAAYQAAGLEISAQSGQQLTRAVRSEKTAPQLVQVTVQAEQAQTAAKLAAALRMVVTQRVEQYHAEGIPELVFRAVPSDEWAGVVGTKASLAAMVVGGLALLVGVNIVALGVALGRNGYEGGDRRASTD